MATAKFTLAVVTSCNGYIARTQHDTPQSWASSEEQVLFFQDVEAADWAIMGRNTHAAADKPNRRRIVFSTRQHGWIRPNQLWINPSSHKPSDLPGLVSHVYPLRHGLILGGTWVHDWFLWHHAIDRVHLSIEPIDFDNGLSIFSHQTSHDPVEVFLQAGFKLSAEHRLNEIGTRYLEFERRSE